MSEGLLLFTTVPLREQAEQLARKLVESHLAACVNIIGPLHSLYYWKNEIVSDTEYKLFVKTATHLKQQVVTFIKTNHPYQVPEITSVPVSFDNPDYAQWLFDYLNHAPAG